MSYTERAKLLGQQVEKACESAGHSLSWLSEVANIPKSTLYRHVHHPEGFNLKHISQIEAALGIDLDAFSSAPEAEDAA